jgi:hypothetical protein
MLFAGTPKAGKRTKPTNEPLRPLSFWGNPLQTQSKQAQI